MFPSLAVLHENTIAKRSNHIPTPCRSQIVVRELKGEYMLDVLRIRCEDLKLPEGGECVGRTHSAFQLVHLILAVD